MLITIINNLSHYYSIIIISVVISVMYYCYYHYYYCCCYDYDYVYFDYQSDYFPRGADAPPGIM